MRCWMIGTMALALLAAGCGRQDAPPAAPEPAATPVANGPAALPESPTVKAIKRRGRLNCGVHQGLVGFAYTDNRGQWRGFDVDFCRATAAAVLGGRQCGAVRAPFGGRALRGPERRADRRAVAQLVLDDDARRGRGLRVRGRQLLRRSGFSGPTRAEPEQRNGADRRAGVRAVRLHLPGQRGRLFPLARDRIPARGLRHRRGGARRLQPRRLRRLQRGHLGPGGGAHGAEQPQRNM